MKIIKTEKEENFMNKKKYQRLNYLKYALWTAEMLFVALYILFLPNTYASINPKDEREMIVITITFLIILPILVLKECYQVEKKYGLLSKYVLAKYIDEKLNNEVISELQSKGIQLVKDNPFSKFDDEFLYSVKLNGIELYTKAQWTSYSKRNSTITSLTRQPYVSWEVWNWLYLEINEVVQTKRKQNQHKKEKQLQKQQKKQQQLQLDAIIFQEANKNINQKETENDS